MFPSNFRFLATDPVKKKNDDKGIFGDIKGKFKKSDKDKEKDKDKKKK